jgi:hypothetical protein
MLQICEDIIMRKVPSETFVSDTCHPDSADGLPHRLLVFRLRTVYFSAALPRGEIW